MSEENNGPEVEPVKDVKFEAKIAKGEDALTLTYVVTNSSSNDVYLLDAHPSVDPTTRAASADLKQFYLCLRGKSTAYFLKGVPPLPSVPVTVRVMPLGTKIEPSATVVREIRIPLPLRERNDWYYPPAPPEDYTIGSVDHLVVDVQILRNSVDGFQAIPAHYAPEFFVVKGKNIPTQVENLRKEFNFEKLSLFIRKGMFTRL